ncbi:MAG: hypothetical protein RIS09_638, partial [Actinomycetota bacterium]
EDLNPAFIVFARSAPAAILLLVYSAIRGKLRSNLKFYKTAIGFAFVEMIFPWWFINLAEQDISSSLAGLLLATVPIFGVLIARFRGDRNAFHQRRIVGMLIGTLGVVILVGLDSITHGISILAVVIVLLAAFGYALGPVIVNKTLGESDSPTVIGMSLLIVSLVYTPFLPFIAPTEVPSTTSIAAVVTLSIVCTVIAFLLFFALIDEIGPVRVTLITYLNPAVALILGVVFLSEPITIGLAIGFPMVIIGSWFASSVNQKYESVNA